MKIPNNPSSKNPVVTGFFDCENTFLYLMVFGGPDGELAASMRYLSQRYTMPYKEVKAILTDIGTEELAHMEMVSAIVHQLTKNLTIDQIKESGFDTYFVDHTTGLWPSAASGMPMTSTVFASKGDPITDLTEDLAAEQKARTTYDNILNLVDDPEVRDPIKFLRQREIVHFQRFGEGKRAVSSKRLPKKIDVENVIVSIQFVSFHLLCE